MKFIHDLIEWWATHDDSFFQIVIGLLIALVGPLITFYVGRSTDFHCTRTGEQAIRCDITRQLLGFQPMDARRVEGIQSAEVEENAGSEGDATYRVILVTSYGREPLTGSFSSGRAPKAELVDRLNSFIRDGQQEILDYQVRVEWWVWALLFGSIGIGVGMILAALRKFMT